MKRLASLTFAVIVIAIALMPAWPNGQAAQRAAIPAIPRTSDGKPDFSGFWDQPHTPGVASAGATVFDKKNMAPFKPGGEALFYEPRTGDPRHDEPRAFCMPSGFPSGILAPYPVQIAQTPGWMVMVGEFQRTTRLVPLDGRPHRDVDPTYYGDSVGRWEGDTLVIDSTKFKRWSLDDYYYIDPTQYRMHSDAFHTIERLRRVDANTIAYQFTIDDPQIFTASWSQDFEMKLHSDWEKVGLYEYVCQENNRCEGGNCK